MHVALCAAVVPQEMTGQCRTRLEGTKHQHQGCSVSSRYVAQSSRFRCSPLAPLLFMLCSTFSACLIWAGRCGGMPGTASNFPDAELKVNALRKSLKPRDCDNWSSSTWRSCTHRSHQRTTYQSVSELSYVALWGSHLDTQSA